MEMKINSRVSFQEHNEYMRGFRRAHANVAWSNKPERDELVCLDSMRLLQVTQPIRETGGSRFLSGIMDWPNLVPVLNVAHYKLSPG